tara:strand:+ start:3904 stop:4599 length:696 start_codon:yes stop_codon:yes gene_type:complete
MSKITITDITEGNTTDVTDVTTTVSSWKSSVVGPENIRDEGLDERMFLPGTAARINDFRNFSNSNKKDYRASDYQYWTPLQTPNGHCEVGPLHYQGQGDILVRFCAELEMPTVGITPVALDKMEIQYRLTWRIPNGGSGTFHYSTRRVGLSKYPRSAIGSSRYKNNITTMVLINPDTPSPSPGAMQPGQELFVGVQFLVTEVGFKTDLVTRNYDTKFSVRNIDLSAAHYRK